MEQDLAQVMSEYNESLKELLQVARELRGIQRDTCDLMAQIVNGGHLRSAVGMIHQHSDVKRVIEIDSTTKPTQTPYPDTIDY